MESFSAPQRVELGSLHTYVKTSFTYYFEQHPVWLLSLEKRYIKSLVFPQFASIGDLYKDLEYTNNLPLYSRILHNFSDIIQCTTKHQGILIISGSITFCSKHITNTTVPTLAVILHSTRLSTKLRNLGFKSIAHSMVGGATNFRLCYYASDNFISP